ncbi:unnamed protein product [Aureobasidium mustum]|uniref:Nucleoside phosphorylase domain-containing protein n=1 Tax=Aureobasidium mustum TaxID=2773714 RepID=A0A9N8JG95_9PEZI|nr:unnamed protein product [Aureobasidium mustum]
MSKRREDYLTGIVYSLDIELEAIKLFLDEIHVMLPPIEPDQNNYTLGSMCGHNVVIAPSRMAGPSPRATAAQSMIRSFPDIRFCLLVGIGSGIPTDGRDIRLGDVIVSKPSAEHGGVVQINITTRQKFSPIGTLGSPSSLLLQAIGLLQARDELGELNLSQDISEILAHARNADLYEFPGRHRDLLFSADYAHARPGENCSSCDHTNLIFRRDRDDQDIVVHYGLIAGSNSSAKVQDANLRDQIGTELDAICFYNKASRLMDTLPCLVIRGVADYADTHESAEWQPYAALAASAYTKQLLSGVDMDTNRGIATATSLDPDLSSATRSNQELDNGASTTADNDGASANIDTLGNTTLVDVGNVTGISAAKGVAQVMISNERLRSVCAIAARRLERHQLQQSVSVALWELLDALREQPQSPVLIALGRLFIQHRSHIAKDITEFFYERADLLNADQVGTTPISDSTLMQRLSDWFPATNVKNTAVDKARPGEVLTPDDQIDLESQELSDDTMLTNLYQLDEILCQGPISVNILSKLKELLLPPVHILLENTLGKCLAETQGVLRITCLVEWELLQLVDNEGLAVDDIDCLFTLSGDFEHARADPLASHEIWETGKELLSLVKLCLTMASYDDLIPFRSRLEAGQTQMQLFKANMNAEKEYAVVNIAGSADYIKTTVNQLAWLTATLRVPHGEMLTVSCINFQPHRTQTGEVLERMFRMSLWEQKSRLNQLMSQDNAGLSCLHIVF